MNPIDLAQLTRMTRWKDQKMKRHARILHEINRPLTRTYSLNTIELTIFITIALFVGAYAGIEYIVYLVYP